MNLLMLVPVLLGMGVCKSWLFFPIAVVSIFFCIRLNKKCKTMEEVWVFVLSFFTLLPTTLRVLFEYLIRGWITEAGLFEGLLYVLQLICYFMMVMSIQMVVMLVVGRVIWPVKRSKVRG